jgi:hypothetical protein
MAIVFPTSPTVGQLFTEAGRSWVWTGSSWDAPTTNNALQIPYGLEFISTTSFSAVASQSISNIFSNKYDNYRIIYSINSSSISTGFNLRFRDSGGVNNTSNYKYGQFGIGAFATESFFTSNSTTATAFDLSGTNATNGTFGSIEINQPFAAMATKVTNVGAGQWLAVSGGGFNGATSFHGITVFPNSGTITGDISVYGYRKS